MKIAVVGATGLVGRKMLEVLAERNFPVTELSAVGSSRSVGSSVRLGELEVEVMSLEQALLNKPDIALFSAGGAVSREWAPAFADAGARVIDNSSAWRMAPGVPLVVPEVNGESLSTDSKIIANPNCSTIQLVVAIAPLHRAVPIRRLVISTYQSITGSGKHAVEQYESEVAGKEGPGVYPYPIFANCLPHCDVFTENDYTREEMKLVRETRKIMGAPELAITATAVRVPVLGGHSESVNIEFENELPPAEIRRILQEAPGVTVLDDPASNTYPMPLACHEKDDVFVGRIRRDESTANAVNLWIVADNLRKGAATNAVQIAELLLRDGRG